MNVHPRHSLKARFTLSIKHAKVSTDGETFSARGRPCAPASKKDQVLASPLKQFETVQNYPSFQSLHTSLSMCVYQ